MVISWSRRALCHGFWSIISVIIAYILALNWDLSLVFKDQRRGLAIRKIQIAIICTLMSRWILIFKWSLHSIMVSWALDLVLHIINSYLLYFLSNIVLLIFTLLDQSIVLKLCQFCISMLPLKIGLQLVNVILSLHYFTLQACVRHPFLPEALKGIL